MPAVWEVIMRLDAGISVEANQLAGVAEMARAAERLGLTGLWTNETRHDSLLPLVLAAEHSARLELGTAVTIAFPRSPMVLAQSAWDLQEFSGGRLLLGLGTQVKAHIERRFSAAWDAPVARLRDYIGALRAIWNAFQTDGKLRYEGPYYRHTLLTPFFNPGPIANPAVPLYIAGVNTGLARLAGELAQGFHVHPFHSREYITNVLRPAVAAGALAAGRPADAVAMAASVFVITGSNAEERERLRARVRQQIAFYASTPTYQPVLAAHGWQDTGAALGRLARAQRWSEMGALIDDAMLAAFAVEAEPDRLGAALRERYTGLVDRISLYLPFVPGERDDFWRATAQELAREPSARYDPRHERPEAGV